MTSLMQAESQSLSRPAWLDRPLGSLRFDWLIGLLSVWMVGGIHLDAWAHHQFEVETFFTPWHGVLYLGFLAVAVVLVGSWLRSVRSRRAWAQAMPVGYELSLVGVLVFVAGGVGDMLWHIVFGIEVNIEALLSPTHLLLALGGGLIATGPLRAAWARRADQPNRVELLPALLSLAILLSVLTFFTAYANPLAEAAFAQGSAPAGEETVFLYQSIGIASVLVYSALLLGLVLLAVRRWRLPFGSLSLVLGLSALLTVSIHEDWHLWPSAVLAGLAGDVLVRWLRPSAQRPTHFRLFAFALPVVFYALYFATLALSGGIWWSVPLWAGAIVLAGTVGWLLSYAFAPPEAEGDRHGYGSRLSN